MKNIFLDTYDKNESNSKNNYKRNFKQLYGAIIITLLSVLSFSGNLYAHSDGAPLVSLGSAVEKGNWRFYAPGYSTCAILGCHYQYPVLSGKGKLMLFVLDKCEPGEIVDILISFKQTDTYYHGFQIAAQDLYYNRLVGKFIDVGEEDTQVEAGGLFATHTKKGTNRKFWHVKWQAPPEDFWVANPVRFYAIGLEADNDGTAMGDYIYKATRHIMVIPKKKEPENELWVYHDE